jgi:hypothetical protein
VELADLQQEDAREGLSGKHRVSLSLGCKSLQSYLKTKQRYFKTLKSGECYWFFVVSEKGLTSSLPSREKQKNKKQGNIHSQDQV